MKVEKYLLGMIVECFAFVAATLVCIAIWAVTFPFVCLALLIQRVKGNERF